MKFPNRVKEFRVKKGLTQKELAKKAELTRMSISSIENGHRSTSWKTMNRISEALDAPISYIFFVPDARNS